MWVMDVKCVYSVAPLFQVPPWQQKTGLSMAEEQPMLHSQIEVNKSVTDLLNQI